MAKRKRKQPTADELLKTAKFASPEVDLTNIVWKGVETGKKPVVSTTKTVTAPTQTSTTSPVAPTATKTISSTPMTPAQKRERVQSARQSRRQADVVRDTKLTVADREQFNQERKAGGHGFQNTLMLPGNNWLTKCIKILL